MMEFKKNILLAAFRTARLWLSLRSMKPLVDAKRHGPVVCLTSHGKRVATAWLAIESIGSGTVKPSRLILWLDMKQKGQPLPHQILQQMSRGLEVKYGSDGLGPHAKYYNHIDETESFSSDLVTADDDILYPPHWLDGLLNSVKADAAEIICYRAHRIQFSEGRILPYKQWARCRSTEPSALHFATGVSGVLYPPKMQAALKHAGKQFLTCTPKADDIWLHAVAIRNGFKIKQVHPTRLHFPAILGDKEAPLHAQNIHMHANDQQIQDTYTADDLALLQAEASLMPKQ